MNDRKSELSAGVLQESLLSFVWIQERSRLVDSFKDVIDDLFASFSYIPLMRTDCLRQML